MTTWPLLLMTWILASLSLYLWLVGKWKWDSFDKFIPNSIFLLIAFHVTPFAYVGYCFTYWGKTSLGEFLVESVYQLRYNGNLNLKCDMWNIIWKIKDLQWVNTFLWLLFKNAISMNKQMVNRHITIEAYCDICLGLEEDMIHVLRVCVDARVVWKVVVDPINHH